jgi:squalene-associated FAD-dependent desaturase
VNERDVIVVGAGVAGLGAACALAGAGRRVTMLERRPYVGGRAYSYLHPALEEVVDSQHVLLGCCTNLIDFCEAAGLAEKIRWYDGQTFLEPLAAGPRASGIELGPLPAPMQYAGSFARARMLSLADKAGIARGLLGLARGNHESDEGSVAGWYGRTGQTEGAIQHFWEPIVLATLNDVGANCSMRYAGKVFYELFLKTRTGGRLGIPSVPLSEFYSAGAELVERRGGQVETRAGVEQLCQLEDGRWRLRAGEREFVAEDVVLALPFEQTRTLVADLGGLDAAGDEVRRELLGKMERFEHSPFISVLLWFDREITALDHAWLLDTTIQWFFHKSRIRAQGAGAGSYVEVIIAGSKRELTMGRAEILEAALGELRRFFPAVAEAQLLKSGILKEARATFSVTPGLDRFRPEQATGIPGLFLAGDWTRTDWPSTMEGAVRSGRLAAGAVVGDRNRFITPDLPASGVMRWLARD